MKKLKILNSNTGTIILFFILIHLFQDSMLNQIHGGSGSAGIVAIFGLMACLLICFFNWKYLKVTINLGYIVALIIAVIFNTNGVDPSGGTTNNLWIIWLVTYVLFLILAMLLDLYVNKKHSH